jgi:hypothetical protein
LTQSQSRPDEETSARIAAQFARAFSELQQSLVSASGVAVAQDELSAARAAIEELSGRLERQLEDDKDQRRLLGDQLAALATSLDRLVAHLQGLSQLMGDLLERLAEPASQPAPAAAAEPSFQPGGEGVSLALSAVPGFQALMDMQKALSSMPQVSGASVERYQEGDSRILLHLKSPVTASEIAGWLRSSTQYATVVEEAKPELSRLRMKVVPATSA